MTPLQILCDSDYFADATRAVTATKAGNRIGLASMTFNPLEPLVSDLMQAVYAAVERGVLVYMLIDAHSFMVGANNTSNGPLLRGEALDASPYAEYQAKYDALQQLANKGGHYRIINQPRSRFTIPVAGRSHIKTIIINDTVYLGGCNLGDTTQIDCMVKLTSSPLADQLYNLLVETAQSGSIRQTLHGTDQTISVDNRTQVFVDAGLPGQSLIMQQALQLIDEAREYIDITCQFFPNSTTALHLRKALKRGVQVRIHFNHPGHQTALWSKVQQLVLAGERLRLPKELFAYQLPATHNRIHLKVIATDQGAMIGSHNYVTLGVRLGTAEMAILRHDPVFSRQVMDTLRPHLPVGP